MDPGSLAEWAAAGVNLLALIGVGIASYAAIKTNQTQRRQVVSQLARFELEDKSRDDRQRSYQARRVAVWVTRGASKWHLFFANSSALPVYDISIRVVSPGTDAVLRRSTIGPCEPRRSISLTTQLRTILEGQPPGPASAADEGQGGLAQVHDVQIEICFTDASGVRWKRTADGRLFQVDSI